MSHLLSTVNAEAAAQADSGWQPGPTLVEAEPVVAPQPRCDLPLPSIGNWVVYHLREGDSRNRRTKFPALVMDGDQDAGTLMLWVVVDDGDTWMQERVPTRVAPEPGWELVQAGGMIEATPGQMKAMGTVVSRPSDYELLVGLEARIAVLEDGSNARLKHLEELSVQYLDRVTALEAKPRLGRPPKPKE